MTPVTLCLDMSTQEIESFWRESARVTYAGNAKPVLDQDKNKVLFFQDPVSGLWYRDTWYSTNNQGFGTTVIGHEKFGTVWFMQYCGFLLPGVKPLLIQALREGLGTTDRFLGCRGPVRMRLDDDYVYYNDVIGTFCDFVCTEVIVKGKGDKSERAHKHACVGKLLLTPNEV